MKRRYLFLVVVVLTVLSIAILLPLSIILSSTWDSSQYDIPGQAVSDSAFASLEGESIHSEILPEAFETLSTDPLIIHESYERFTDRVLIDIDTARVTARDWLSVVGPASIEWTLTANYSQDAPPSWRFTFGFPGFIAYVIVERITGRVIEYSMKYLHDFDPTPLTAPEAETLSLNFLRDQDYSIPLSARYMGGFPYDCWRFYEITFQEFVGDIAVPQSHIVVTASAFFQGISYFRYHWLGLDIIESEGFISPSFTWSSAVARNRIDEDVFLEDYSLGDTTLIFVTTTEATEPVHPTFRLAWEIRAISPSNDSMNDDVRLYASPTSGSLFGYRLESGGYRSVQHIETYHSIPVLVYIAGVASGIMILVAGALVYSLSRD
ncbi:hypothetical protein EU520_01050 [Candidatus Thorarchaeota archaeon]|nr:MAG: hypothetical protein EU520_01050 [Candidatus Thorarchaeota archaeon]